VEFEGFINYGSPIFAVGVNTAAGISLSNSVLLTQNAINRTLVAPYSARPSPGAPVSAPITWDELDDPDLAPDRWTIDSLAARLKTVGDLFAPALSEAQKLPPL